LEYVDGVAEKPSADTETGVANQASVTDDTTGAGEAESSGAEVAAGKPRRHLRDMLVKSMSRSMATVDPLEVKKEDSLTRIKDHIGAAAAIVAERDGKGVHKGIQEAIRGVE